MELYENIRRLRKEQKMSQDELAKKAGYTDRSSIAKIESGDVDIPQSKIMLIARALGVDAGDLMGNDGVVYSAEQLGKTISLQLVDKDLLNALPTYLRLPPAKKKHVIETIYLLDDEP